MGYSMGGYGALMLAAKNPEIFKTGIALSMSFRTDEQYLNEPQGVFLIPSGLPSLAEWEFLETSG